MSQNTNDPFDEFEFKPLTEGLGFHKKTATQKVEFKGSHLSFDNTTETKTTRPTDLTQSKNTFQNQKPTSNRTGTQSPSFNLQPPLPRVEAYHQERTTTINVPTIEDDSISKAQTAVNEILKTLNQKKQQEESLLRSKRKTTWVNCAPSLSAGFLDTMLIVAMFLLSLISMLIITKIDLVANLSHPDPEYLIYWAAFSLLASVQMTYYVSCRAFLGFTPGEWAFDQRCGSEIQMATTSYVLKVLARSVLNAATGFVIMPILSFAFGFDILAKISGVQLQSQKYV